MAIVIAVALLKGGTGKSVTAANLAALLARSGRRTLLVEADGKGDALAAVGGGKASARGGGEESAAAESAQPAQPAGSGEPSHASAPAEASGCPGLQVAAGFDRERAEDIARASPPWDAVVVDCPAEEGTALSMALATADVVLLPAPDLPRVAEAVARTVALVRQSARPDRMARVWLLRTRAPRRKVMERPEARGAAAPQAAIGARAGATRGSPIPTDVPRLPVDVPEDDAVPRALAAGKPLVDHAPRSRAARAYVELSRMLLPLVTPETRGEQAHDRNM